MGSAASNYRGNCPAEMDSCCRMGIFQVEGRTDISNWVMALGKVLAGAWPVVVVHQNGSFRVQGVLLQDNLVAGYNKGA